jgi:hypothetical protein
MELLGERVMKRSVQETEGVFELREPAAAYSPNFAHKNEALSDDNGYFWNQRFGQSKP